MLTKTQQILLARVAARPKTGVEVLNCHQGTRKSLVKRDLVEERLLSWRKALFLTDAGREAVQTLTSPEAVKALRGGIHVSTEKRRV
jgi:hypothetical protein